MMPFRYRLVAPSPVRAFNMECNFGAAGIAHNGIPEPHYLVSREPGITDISRNLISGGIRHDRVSERNLRFSSQAFYSLLAPQRSSIAGGNPERMPAAASRSGVLREKVSA